MQQNRVIISLGSNCKDKVDKMQQCLAWLADTFQSLTASSTYCTDDIHGSHLPKYLNAVAIFHTDMDEATLNLLLKSQEIAMGRDAKCKELGLVPIDLDIVVFNDTIVRPKDFARAYFKIGYSEVLLSLKELPLTLK